MIEGLLDKVVVVPGPGRRVTVTLTRRVSEFGSVVESTTMTRAQARKMAEALIVAASQADKNKEA